MEIEGIILAAGLSTRAQSFKMTLSFKGKTVIENTIEPMLSVCSRIYVVGGFNIEALQPIICGYSNVELVYNKDYLRGMYSSVKVGMSRITAERFFFTPGDYPLITPMVYSKMLEYQAPVVIPAFQGKKGHPVLFSRDIARQVQQGKDLVTLREVIVQNEALVVDIDCRGIIMDLDTMEDYTSLLEHIG